MTTLYGNLDLTDLPDKEAHNKAIEAKEIEWLQTSPDKVFLYVQIIALSKRTIGSRMVAMTNGGDSRAVASFNGDKLGIATFLGTNVATHIYIGPRVNGGLFSFHSYKRQVTCQIFGVKYHGWYFESSGDYCRLTRNKNQKGN